MGETLCNYELIGPIVEDDEGEEFSEWKVYGRGRSLNEGYQNRDFRNSEGLPLIDPEAYCKLRDEIKAIRDRSSGYLIALFIATDVVFRVVAPVNSLRTFVGYLLVLVILIHFFNKHYRFKKVRTELLELVFSYEVQFMENYGVTLGYSKRTPNRWFLNDDSGIYLRRPRRTASSMPPSDKGVDMSSETFPPIYIRGLYVPGRLHIDETSYDASMKVDSNAWQLLQSTYQEMIQCSDVYKFVTWIPLLLFLSWMAWSLLVSSLYPKQPLMIFLLGLPMFPVMIFLSARCFFAYEKRTQQKLHAVTDRVNVFLQRNETTAHLMLRILDVEDVEHRRYQFEERRPSVVDPIILDQDIP